MDILNFLKQKGRILILLTVIFTLNIFVYAKGPKGSTVKQINLKVTVIDSSRNAPLELVDLILKRNETVININLTDHSGNAIFHDLEPGEYTLIAHFIGYKSYDSTINLNEGHNVITIHLAPSAIALGEVLVKGTKQVHVSNFINAQSGNLTFVGETYHAPPTFRTTALVQQNLTGAVRAPTGEVHIRGQHGEFSYFIDGIPIPLGVFGGLNEVVDPRVIKDIVFYTGGFPAEYGGQTAAVIAIRNEVPPGGFHLSLSTYGGSYLTSSNENLGPDVGAFKALNSNGQGFSLSDHAGNLGFFLSGSRSETDRRIDQPVPELFHDHGFDYFLYGKLDYIIDNNNYFTSNLNFGETQTQVPFDSTEGINLDNQNSYNSFQTLSFYHTFSNEIDHESNLFVGLFVREGGLKFNTSPYDQMIQYIDNDTTTGYTVDQHMTFTSYGTRLIYSDQLSHQFGYSGGLDLSITNGTDSFNFKDLNGNGPLNQNRFTGSDFGLFVQTNIHPLEWTMLDAGLRYDQNIAPSIPFESQLSPRLKLSIYLNETNTVYASYDRLFIPTNIEGLSAIATAVGDSSTATLPERDNLYEVGIIHNFSYGLSTKLDYFHKDSSPGLDDETLGNTSIAVNVNINNIHTSGIELSLRYSNPENPFSAYLNGSLIHAYGIGPVSGGFIPPDSSTAPFDLDHDERLAAVIGLNYQPDNWFLNLVGIYGSGLANGNEDYVFKTGLFDFNQGAHTTPSWILNLSGGYTFNLGDGQTLEPSLYVTNLLDHGHLLKGAFFSGAYFEERRNVVFKLTYEM
jgi:TonB dependent receptor-like, beta-barrel/CarboxypepD_reg-like domain